MKISTQMRALVPALLGAAALLATLTLIYFWQSPYFWLRPLNLYDEGVSLLGAQRLLGGEVPYRDFWTMYPPLKFLSLASWFAVAGDTLAAARGFFAGVSLLGSAALFLLLWRQGSLWWAIGGTLLVGSFAILSLTPTLLLLIALAFAQLLRAQSLAWAAVLGGLLAAAVLLRWDFGGIVALATLSLFAVFAWRQNLPREQFLRLLGVAGGVALVVVLPVGLWLFATGALSQMLAQTLAFPLLGEYSDLRWLPMIAADPLAVWQGTRVDLYELSGALQYFIAPFALLLAGKTWLLLAHRQSAPWLRLLPAMLWAAVVVAGILYATHRADAGHLLFLNTLAIILLLLTKAKWQLPWVVALTPLFALLLLAPISDFWQQRTQLMTAPLTAYSFGTLPTSTDNDDLQRALELAHGKRVFVGTSDTSRVYVNNVMLPFLLRQPVLTKYHELHTGVVTQADVQAEMITEIATAELIILWDFWQCEANASCISTGNHLLDDFIAREFVVTEEFGRYTVMKRR